MSTPDVRYPKRPRPRFTHPLQKGIHSFLEQYISKQDTTQSSKLDINALASSIPKRYTVYPPLLLLPPSVFSSTATWKALISQLHDSDLQALYKAIAEAFQSQGVTHIALNSPISPLTHLGTSNFTRSPSSLIRLYGDFGPRELLGPDDKALAEQPAEPDFRAALWVHTHQNGGIFQTWAPVWTMFSRGNVREKARILGDRGAFEGLDGVDGVLGQALGEIAVVDMYVGIGYFAFSYLKKGVGRVWGWEVNGWSVEGLRRGCRGNGWEVRVLRVHDDGEVEDEDGRVGHDALEGLLRDLRSETGREIRLVVFHGDNRWAGGIMNRIQDMSEKSQLDGDRSWLNIRHVNLGLLPSSRLSWEDSIDMIDSHRGGWVHVHENVDIREMEHNRDFVLKQIHAHLGSRGIATCSHIEQVKTYAPGVMHCVFDIHIEPRSIRQGS